MERFIPAVDRPEDLEDLCISQEYLLHYAGF